MNQVEDRLREQLHRRADGVVVGDGWAAIAQCIERRQRGRHVRRTALTVAMVAVLCGGAVALAGRAGQGRVVNPATGLSGPLPRLVVVLEGLELESASGFEPGATTNEKAVVDVPPMSTPEVKPPSGATLSRLTVPGRGLNGPVLFIRTIVGGPPGLPRAVMLGGNTVVGGQPAALQQTGALPVRNLTWQDANGVSVQLTAARMTADELVAAGQALMVDATGAISWPGGAPPAGLVHERTSVISYDKLRAESEVDYTWRGDRMTLRLIEGGSEALDDQIVDRMASATEMSEASIGGQQAAWIGAEQALHVLWAVRPGVVAELLAEGDARAQAGRALGTIRVIAEAEWNKLVKESAVKNTKDEASTGDPLATVVPELCRMRGIWLGAGDTGDAGTQAKAADTVRALLEKGTAAGWGQNSDILLVIRKLLGAMEVGDRQAVLSSALSSAPGGCP